MLENYGYQVQVLTSPVLALEMFQQSPGDYDLIITDMTMPEMTGDALVKEVLSIRKDIPVILCTGYSARISPENAKSLGIRKYIEKPLVKREFILAVRQVLDS